MMMLMHNLNLQYHNKLFSFVMEYFKYGGECNNIKCFLYYYQTQNMLIPTVPR